MARKVLHRETVSSVERFRKRLAELQAQYPSPSTVTFRRAPRFGGWNLTVTGEGPTTSIQTRGNCQFCGRDQVIKDGRLVKHGYKRPGTGYEVGRCPGAGWNPLQVTDAKTHQYLAEERVTLEKLQATLPHVAKLERQAEAALDASGENVYRARNDHPYLRNGTYASQAEKDAHAVKVAAWEKQYPAYVAHRDAIARHSTHRNAISQSEAFIVHFQQLIDAKLVGTPFITVEK